MGLTKTGRLWTFGFVNLLAFDIVYQFGSYMTNTIISVYAVALGATYATAGLLAGLNPGTSMAMRPITGLITDLFGKKTLLVASSVLFLLATLGCSSFTSFALLGACRILQGLSFALRSVCVISLVACVVPAERLGSGMGWMGLSSTLSNAIGPLVAENVGSALGYQKSFLVASALLAAGLALAVLFKNPQPSGEGAWVKGADAGPKAIGKRLRGSFGLSSFFYRENAVLSLLAGLSGAPQAISISFVLLAASQRGIGDSSLFFTSYALAALVSRPLMGRLADSVGSRKVVAPLLAAELLGTIVLACMSNIGMVMGAAALLGAGQGALYSIFQAESVRGVSPAEAGRAANTFYIGPDINMCFSPIVGGVLLGAFGVGALYAFGCAAVVLAMVIFAFRERHRRAEGRIRER